MSKSYIKINNYSNNGNLFIASKVFKDIAIEKIKKADNIVIYTHANVDGDAIGSAFAFYFLLKEMGKNVDVFAKTTMPNQLKFLDIEDILNKKTVDKYNLAIAVDCNTIKIINIHTCHFYSITINCNC